MTDEELLEKFERACGRDSVMEILDSGYFFTYPKPRVNEDPEKIKKGWLKLVNIMIERELI